jgi:hypothetical protein
MAGLLPNGFCIAVGRDVDAVPVSWVVLIGLAIS